MEVNMEINENSIVTPLSARIHHIRGQSVMLDSDLAGVYEVETKALNRAVKPNESRFPECFTFQLSQDGWDALRCQFGTLNTGRGQHCKYLPYAFTEHGSVMAKSGKREGNARAKRK